MELKSVIEDKIEDIDFKHYYLEPYFNYMSICRRLMLESRGICINKNGIVNGCIASRGYDENTKELYNKEDIYVYNNADVYWKLVKCLKNVYDPCVAFITVNSYVKRAYGNYMWAHTLNKKDKFIYDLIIKYKMIYDFENRLLFCKHKEELIIYLLVNGICKMEDESDFIKLYHSYTPDFFNGEETQYHTNKKLKEYDYEIGWYKKEYKDKLKPYFEEILRHVLKIAEEYIYKNYAQENKNEYLTQQKEENNKSKLDVFMKKEFV